ncbi:hypothetical protein SCP_0407390 [Sparassis crispa]|uniref:Uncharacterized protein n=1 Tax=Sparassis crispa TaxID=139825 RepID=A0A401GJL9_9APHY|nr:hypothetical protein SCP_0407390 [Sparassis crispa]GBE82355.1 hypothetical protein SCP_0407390 [Sparassis crispa]
MSHLPPKPDFDQPPPPRYPPDSRHYARPSRMSTPDRTYPHRTRDSYVPRSPRSRPTGDTYIAPRPMDTYRGGSRPPMVDSYVAAYDHRRDDDRYRDVHRDRGPPGHRDWRERDHPPHEYKYVRGSSRERGAWNREREHDRWRRWEEPDRRGYDRQRRERDYSPPRRQDIKRERVRDSPERTWISRPSKSPPRRMAPDDQAELSPSRKDRSPPPHIRTPSQSRLYSRPSSPTYARTRDQPARGRSRSIDSRRDYSAPRSPRVDDRSLGTSRRRASYDTHRGRDMSRGYSASPRRRRDDSSSRDRSLSDTDIHEAGELGDEPLRSRTLSRSSSPSRSRSRTMSPRRHNLDRPRSRSAEVISPRSRSLTPPIKREPSEQPSPIEPPHSDAKGKRKEVVHVYDHDGDVKMEDILSPSGSTREAFEGGSAPHHRRRSHSPLAPLRSMLSSPVSPRTPHHLPPRPDWSRGTAPAPASGTPAEGGRSTPDISGHNLVIPPTKSTLSVMPEEAEIARLRSQRTHLAAEYAALSRATKRTLHELKMASTELRFAERRRALADAQLEKARAGILGIDYTRKIELAGTTNAWGV